MHDHGGGGQPVLQAAQVAVDHQARYQQRQQRGPHQRSARSDRPARVHPDGARRARVELLAAEEGVAPGQACVFYAAEGTRVLGGGWITR